MGPPCPGTRPRHKCGARQPQAVIREQYDGRSRAENTGCARSAWTPKTMNGQISTCPPPRAHQLRAHLPSPMAVVHCKQTPALMVLLKVVHRKNKHHIEADLLPPPVTSTSRFMPPKRTLFLAVPSPSPSCQ